MRSSLQLTFAAFVGLTILKGTDAHSWLECADWQAPAGEWRPENGNCAARPRHFAGGNGFNSQLQAGFGADTGRNGMNTQYLSIPDPSTSNAYSSASPYGRVQPGQEICWTWPAKNHAMPYVGTCGADNSGCPVKVYWPETPGVQPSTAVEWEQHPVVAQAPFGGDCNDIGDTDKQPCGMCFTVPDRANGFYSVMWWWEFNANEFYRDGMDYEVVSSGVTAPPPTPRPTPGPTPPPAASPTPGPASGGGTPGSTFTVYRDSLASGFYDWSWAEDYAISEPDSRAYAGTAAIRFKPDKWQAVYIACGSDDCIYTSQWFGISFWVNGGSSSGQLVTFETVSSGTETGAEHDLSEHFQRGEWVNVEIAFSDLQCGTDLSGFWFQAKQQEAQPDVYIDEIELVYGLANGRSLGNPTGLTADSPEILYATSLTSGSVSEPRGDNGANNNDDTDGLSPIVIGVVGAFAGLLIATVIVAALIIMGVLAIGREKTSTGAYKEFQMTD